MHVLLACGSMVLTILSVVLFRSSSEKTNHKKKKSTAVKTIDRAPRNLCD